MPHDQSGPADEQRPGRGLERLNRVDPWGESGPVDQAAADVALDADERDVLVAFPTFGDPRTRPVEFVEAYARLAATLIAQLTFVDALIAQAYARDGVSAFVLTGTESVVVGKGDTATVESMATGQESLSGLLKWQGQLQAQVQKALADGIRFGISAQQADLTRRYGTWVATSLEAFAGELGVDWSSAPVRRAAQRAILATREKLAVGSTSPDAAGPPLSTDERAEMHAGPSTGG